MRTLVVLMCIAIVASAQAFAQVNSATTVDSLSKFAKADSIAWKYRGIIGAGLNFVELTNWTAGGQDAVTIRALFLGSLDYTDTVFSWENDLDLGYSIQKQGDQQFRKADDRIIFGTKASLKQTEQLRYTAFLEFRTQFYVGYNYDVPDSTSPSGFTKISNIMAPGYLTGSLGAEWTPLPQFRFLVAPIASRATFVLDEQLSNQGAFGVDSGQTVRADFGGLINATVDWEVFHNVRWNAKFNAFCPYRFPDLWILTLENAIIMKVNSFLSVGFLTSLFYDDRVAVLRDDGTTGPATQIKNQLTIDFTYQLTNF